MRGDWLARPKWALLGGGLIADGENEVERKLSGAANSSQLFERRPLVS
jgi:hypothetical protein